MVSLAKTEENGEVHLAVQGLHQQDYEETSAPDAEKLSYNTATNILGAQKPEAGIDLKAVAQQAAGANNAVGAQDIGLWNRPEIVRYNVLKVATDGKLRVTGTTAADILPSVFEVSADNLDGGNPRIADRFLYFVDNLGRSENNNARNFVTTAFDIVEQNNVKCASVVFDYKNENDEIFKKLRLYCKNNVFNNQQAKVDLNLDLEDSLENLSFYDMSISAAGAISGKAVVMEKNGNALWSIDLAGNTRIANRNSITPSVIALNTKPKNFVLDETKTKVLVITENDSLVSLNLARIGNDGTKQFLNADEITRSKVERNLADLLPDEKLENPDLKINPTSMAIKNVGGKARLLIGSDSLKAVLSVPVDEVVSDEPAATTTTTTH